MRIFKPNQKQNLIVFMEPSENGFDISLKGGTMILNRFCIDEDAAFELSGVNYFKKSSAGIIFGGDHKLNTNQKGTENSF